MKLACTALALALWVTSAFACVTTPPPQAEPPPATTKAGGPPVSSPVLPPPAGAAASPPGPHACHLSAPRKSDDACKTDADCGPSDPCHAKACVAKAKSKPRGPDVMCTMLMACESADANRCGCFENRCALIPPDDAPKP